MKENCFKFCFSKRKKKKTTTKNPRNKTTRISSTGSIPKCQILPLINCLVSAVSSSLHLLLELFSYVKVCSHSTHTVKGRKEKETWHNAPVNKTLT